MPLKSAIKKWFRAHAFTDTEDSLEFGLEPLESRLLMAADISLHGGTLKIRGTNSPERIDVDGQGAGQVAVYVNGSYRNTFSGVHSIKADLKGGNDGLHLSAVNISKNVNVKMGDGADTFDVDTTGQFSTALGDTGIFGTVRVHMGGEAGDITRFDLVGNGYGVDVGKSLSVVGVADIELDGFGTTATSPEPGDINVGRNLSIKMTSHGNAGGRSESLYLDDVNVSGKANIRGSHGADDARVVDSRFYGPAKIKLQGGNDTLELVDNRFESKVMLHGGHGTNSLYKSANIYYGKLSEVNFDRII